MGDLDSRGVVGLLRAQDLLPPAPAQPLEAPAADPPWRMPRPKILRRLDVDLTTARTALAPLDLPVVGNVLICGRTTTSSDNVEIAYDEFSDYIPVGRGFFLRGVPFNRLRITNSAQPGSTMVLIYTTDYLDDEVGIQ